MSRTIAKLPISLTVDIPDPFPFMEVEEQLKGKLDEKTVVVTRNKTGTLLMVHVITGDAEAEVTKSYVVPVVEIVKGIVAAEEKIRENI